MCLLINPLYAGLLILIAYSYKMIIVHDHMPRRNPKRILDFNYYIEV
jgi:hypothetical protein